MPAHFRRTAVSVFRKDKAEFKRSDFAYLINSHEHSDHTFGNSAYSDIPVVGSDLLRAAMLGMKSDWHITKQKHAKNTFTGEGAKLYGGRWNNPGKLVVYTAESRALALAEILVHLEPTAVLSRYIVFQVEIDESYIAHLGLRDLPKNWRAEPAPKRLQTLGDEWLDSGKSAVLRIPSAIVVGEFNYLLNPLHPDFSELRIHSPKNLSIDKRLVK